MKVSTSSAMAIGMKVATFKAYRMGMEYINGITEHSIQACSRVGIGTEEVNGSPEKVNTRVTGSRT